MEPTQPTELWDPENEPDDDEFDDEEEEDDDDDDNPDELDAD